MSTTTMFSFLFVILLVSSVFGDSQCDKWISWVPPVVYPAIVLQFVSEHYVDLEKNFIRLMEMNSDITRNNLLLMCMENSIVPVFESFGIRCVPIEDLGISSHGDLWVYRVKVLSCLVSNGYNVIMSDSDALWLGDPMEYINSPEVIGSSIVASRGYFPRRYSDLWGSSICMGFAFFKSNSLGMSKFMELFSEIVTKRSDDQVAVNEAIHSMNIVWDNDSDMRYVQSKGLGKGSMYNDTGGVDVVLLPHDKFTRVCKYTPISNETIVAHCLRDQNADAKLDWMKEKDLWHPEELQ